MLKVMQLRFDSCSGQSHLTHTAQEWKCSCHFLLYFVFQKYWNPPVKSNNNGVIYWALSMCQTHALFHFISQKPFEDALTSFSSYKWDKCFAQDDTAPNGWIQDSDPGCLILLQYHVSISLKSKCIHSTFVQLSSLTITWDLKNIVSLRVFFF